MLSVRLAEAFDGEIVSADSRLFYREMNIGTAKPTAEDRARARHHLVDIADPDETVGLAEFQSLAREAIEDIQSRGKLPILVGGSGQYVRAMVEGWSIPGVEPDPAQRAELVAQAKREGAQALHDRLAKIDPVAAERIDARNVRRVVRALEVCLITGRPISEQQRKQPPSYPIQQIGLTMPRSELFAQADRRVDAMIEGGLAREVEQLLGAGYGWELPAMSGLGYAQFRALHEEGATLEEIAVEIRRATHGFIRRQYNWFRLTDRAISWFDVTTTTAAEIEEYVSNWLGGSSQAPVAG